MTANVIINNSAYADQLGHWLYSKAKERSCNSQFQYHLFGRGALLAISFATLTEVIGRTALSKIALIGPLLSIAKPEKAKEFVIEQMQKKTEAKSISWGCFYSLNSPKNLTKNLHPEQAAINSLKKQFDRAQNQAREEEDKAFKYLKAPGYFAETTQQHRISNYEVGICHYIGKREEMEDEHLATSFDLTVNGRNYPVQLFGIFDGHNGFEASSFVKKNLQDKLETTLDKECAKSGISEATIKKTLKMVFEELDEEFTEEKSGTTATVAMIVNGNIWTANLGDSRTILDNGIQLSEDAKPSDPYYQSNIEKRNGFIRKGRISGRLAPARTIGDHHVDGVNHRPKITVYSLEDVPEKGHLILACDGVYDVSSTRQVAKAVVDNKSESAIQLARNIVYSAYEADSDDNLSVLVVKFL